MTPPKSLMSQVGAAIRAWRLKSGLTMGELAERAAVDPGFLAYIETGKKMPSFATAAKLAQAMGLSLSELLSSIAARDTSAKAMLRRRAAVLCDSCEPADVEHLAAAFKLLGKPKKARALRQLTE